MTKVKLRNKLISGNRKSLYLDFYPAIPHSETGKLTRREFLGLYIFDKPNPEQQQHNTKTLHRANELLQERKLFLQNNRKFPPATKKFLNTLLQQVNVIKNQIEKHLSDESNKN